MDKKLIIASVLILALQVFALVADVDIYPIEDFHSNELQPRTRIGHVVYKKQNVKRRNLGSIVWEDASPSSELMSYDSVLTLDNSSAQIHLEKNVEIDLHENTLIVLEPPTNAGTDNLRIRFSRGYFKTQNGSTPMQIGNEMWEIETSPGTHLGVKNLNGTETEIEVLKGQIQFENHKNPNKVERIEKGTKITVQSDSSIERIQMTEDVSWKHKNEERVYAHQFPTPFVLRWRGASESIRKINPDKSVEILATKLNETSRTLQLLPGTYYFSLIQKGKSSREFVLQVLPAPKIIYTAPLPRDRFALDSKISFRWTPVEAANNYEVELKSANSESERLRSDMNFTSSPIQLQGDLIMRVSGVDELGFRIPPFYSIPLYRIPDPLSAPKLVAPAADPRAPASNENLPKKPKGPPKTSHQPHQILQWISELLFTPAHAEEPRVKKNVVFSWFKVEGADFYNIEISSTPDFAKPEVMAKVSSEKFSWGQYKKTIYYWRVAAGTHSGRLGLFSESAIIDLSQIDNIYSGELSTGVHIEAMTLPNSLDQNLKPATPVSSPAPDPAPALTAVSNEDAQPTRKSGKWSAHLAANLHHKNYSTKQDFTGTLSGFADASISTTLFFENQTEEIYVADIRYTKINWEPQELAFQNELQSDEIQVHTYLRYPNQNFSFGLSWQTLSLPQRAGLEQLSLQDHSLYGGSIEYDIIAAENIQFNSRASVLVASGLTAINFNNSLNYQLQKNKHGYFVGGDLDFKIFFGKDQLSGFHLNSGVHIGRSW